MSPKLNEISVSVNLKAYQLAYQFALEQDTLAKGKQVYLNTLAIYAVRDFLEEFSFETDLEAGDSWNAAIRCFHDVADLLIPNIGKIECRPILPGETTVFPPELEDRIGYVVVKFQEELSQVQLLGYYPTIEPESSQELQITELEPIENLIDYLFRLELANDYMNSDDEVAVKVKEKFDTRSIPEIVAQLERIYRTCDESDRRHVASDFLTGLTGAVREISDKSQVRSFRAKSDDFDEDNEEDLTDLAEDLLDKLSEIWGRD